MGLTDYTVSDKKYFESGRKYERERIIKLLEDYIPNFYELSANTDAGKYPIEHLIELIVGEQK